MCVDAHERMKREDRSDLYRMHFFYACLPSFRGHTMHLVRLPTRSPSRVTPYSHLRHRWPVSTAYSYIPCAAACAPSLHARELLLIVTNRAINQMRDNDGKNYCRYRASEMIEKKVIPIYKTQPKKKGKKR